MPSIIRFGTKTVFDAVNDVLNPPIIAELLPPFIVLFCPPIIEEATEPPTILLPKPPNTDE